jgi:hypothetical protein
LNESSDLERNLILTMMYISTFLLSLSALQSAHGFAAVRSPAFFGVSHSTAVAASREGYFQLEELEDQDTATTEVFLKADNTVDVGETDGPLHIKASGTWKETPQGEFEMVLKRTFEAGRESQTYTDMGEFDFEVERTFTGEITKVGASMAVTGSIHYKDELLGDEEVGYFNMIETTKARKGEKDE